jgi:hypothetical protein
LKKVIRSNISDMKIEFENRLSIIVILAGLLVLPRCDEIQNSSGENGFLQGIITIGPICPVESVPPDPACLPTAETYKAYPVSVWTANGKIKIIQINPALDGTYRTELAPGNYKLVLEKEQNIIGGTNLLMCQLRRKKIQFSI